jgi:hypothetical protein
MAVINPSSHGDNNGNDDADSKESPPPMFENPKPLVLVRPDEVLGANNHFSHADSDDVDQFDNEVLADEKTDVKEETVLMLENLRPLVLARPDEELKISFVLTKVRFRKTKCLQICHQDIKIIESKHF